MIVSESALMEVFVQNLIFLIRRKFHETSTQVHDILNWVVFCEKSYANTNVILKRYGVQNWEKYAKRKPATE
jgi:hypothetical protein